jgi:hypothetical protein
MDRMSQERPLHVSGSADAVADALDGLHPDQATAQGSAPAEAVSGEIPVDRVESVLQRAIELDVTTSQPGSIDADTLTGVAAELGIDESAVRRAFAEEQVDFADDPPNVWDRLLGPDRIVESRIVLGPRELVSQDAEVWFRRNEGLRLRSRSEAGAVWEANTGALHRLRADLFGQAKPSLRLAKTVTLQVQPVGADEQLVSIQADAAPLQERGKRLLGVVAAASVLAAVAGAAVFASPAGLLVGAAVAFLIVPVIAGFRNATGRLRDGVGRALDAVGAAEELGLRKPDIDHFMQIGRRWLRNLRGAFGKQP